MMDTWLEGRRIAWVPSLTWGPKEMFSVAPRSTFFFGGMVAGDV